MYTVGPSFQLRNTLILKGDISTVPATYVLVFSLFLKCKTKLTLIECGHLFINPLRMRERITVVCLSVCMYVCKRSNCSSADLCHPNVALPESARYLEGFRLVDFAKMALFKSYAVIYLSIAAAICDVLQVSHSLSVLYCAARVTFDRRSLTIAHLAGLELGGSI